MRFRKLNKSFGAFLDMTKIEVSGDLVLIAYLNEFEKYPLVDGKKEQLYLGRRIADGDRGAFERLHAKGLDGKAITM